MICPCEVFYADSHAILVDSSRSTQVSEMYRSIFCSINLSQQIRFRVELSIQRRILVLPSGELTFGLQGDSRHLAVAN
jgi:hypothetical protein